MVDPTLPLPGLSPVSGKAVMARFDGGELSSDAGVLALREIESRLGVAERLASCLDDPRAPEQTVHSLAAIIRFRLLMIWASPNRRCANNPFPPGSFSAVICRLCRPTRSSCSRLS